MTDKHQHIHFIAIGGSLMHNLALALHGQGYKVTGSDDEIFEPSRSKLQSAGLLPDAEGWFPEKLDNEVSAVIVGMHARKDNGELARAHQLGIPVFSFPEFLYRESQNKQRIVIAGSHGKSTITAMIMHVLQELGREFDYAIGAEVQGFDTMVRLSDAPVIVIEGDEYHTSPEEPTPKFMHYHHHIGLISGIEWDHINVFPSETDYVGQFKKFADLTPKAGSLVYNSEDSLVNTIGSQERDDVLAIPYATPDYEVRDGVTILKTPEGEFPLKIFGRHNMQNLMGAKSVLNRIGVTDAMFYPAIATFSGAGKRLQPVFSHNNSIIYRDYAHAPSKVRATVAAIKEQYADKKIIACLELHTFSSLMHSFLPNYKDAMNLADVRVVYFNPMTVRHKKLPALSPIDIQKAFQDDSLKVVDDREALMDLLKSFDLDNSVLLLMSSGTFDNLDLSRVKELLNNE